MADRRDFIMGCTDQSERRSRETSTSDFNQPELYTSSTWQVDDRISKRQKEKKTKEPAGFEPADSVAALTINHVG